MGSSAMRTVRLTLDTMRQLLNLTRFLLSAAGQQSARSYPNLT